MEKEKHEELLNELLSADLENSRKTEILQELRADNTEMLENAETLTSSNEKLQKDNDDLVLSNSKLFRQMGIVGNENKEKEEEQKEYSETVTLEELEGSNA